MNESRTPTIFNVSKNCHLQDNCNKRTGDHHYKEYILTKSEIQPSRLEIVHWHKPKQLLYLSSNCPKRLKLNLRIPTHTLAQKTCNYLHQNHSTSSNKDNNLAFVVDLNSLNIITQEIKQELQIAGFFTFHKTPKNIQQKLKKSFFKSRKIHMLSEKSLGLLR